MTDDAPQVELYYSYRSPYSYLAIGRLKRWAEAERVRIAVRDPAFFDQVNPLFVSYLMRDTQRVAEYLGVPFRWPRPDPVEMQLEPRRIPAEQPYIHRLTRLGAAAEQRGKGLDFTYQAGTMMWDGTVEGWHQGEHLAEACTRAGLDLAEMDAAVAAEPQTYIDIIEANQQAHREAGHWGVPTMVFEGEPFFGQDRIDLLQWRGAWGRLGRSRAGGAG